MKALYAQHWDLNIDQGKVGKNVEYLFFSYMKFHIQVNIAANDRECC